jgi:hypothetical protein
MVLHEVCIVPDYFKDPAQNKQEGHFLLNDWVHRAPDDRLTWHSADEDSMAWAWA